MVQPLLKTVRQFLKKLKRELPCHPVVSLLGVYLREIKSRSQRYLYSGSLQHHFTIAQIWK